MRLSAFLLMPLIAATAACGGGSGSAEHSGRDVAASARQAPVDVELPSDQAIINLVYDPFYSVPDGFFVDERAGSSQSYTVHHVMDESHSFEMCTDDFHTAEALEAADNASRSVQGYYVGAHENHRYFEFVRELSYDDDIGNIGDLTSPGYARVFKCSNTSRDGVDRSQLSGYSGRINSRPIDQTTVRQFVEYFWQFAFFPERYKKVIDSYSSTDTARMRHSMLLGFASTQGAGRCDRIEVVEWRFSADPQSGDVMSEFKPLREFEAQLIAGTPHVCE